MPLLFFPLCSVLGVDIKVKLRWAILTAICSGAIVVLYVTVLEEKCE